MQGVPFAVVRPAYTATRQWPADLRGHAGTQAPTPAYARRGISQECHCNTSSAHPLISFAVDALRKKKINFAGKGERSLQSPRALWTRSSRPGLVETSGINTRAIASAVAQPDSTSTMVMPVLTVAQHDLIYNMTSLGLASMAASTVFFFLRLSSFKEEYRAALCFTGLVTFIAM